MGGALCITHAAFHMSQDQPARFGFIVSKAVGNAVTRNLVRRRLKHIADQRLQQGFRGADVVFRALPASGSAGFAELYAEINRSLDRVEQLRTRATR